jgi:hypothetical protein
MAGRCSAANPLRFGFHLRSRLLNSVCRSSGRCLSTVGTLGDVGEENSIGRSGGAENSPHVGNALSHSEHFPETE